MILDDALEFETAIVGSAVVESQDNITELKVELIFAGIVPTEFSKNGEALRQNM